MLITAKFVRHEEARSTAKARRHEGGNEGGHQGPVLGRAQLVGLQGYAGESCLGVPPAGGPGSGHDEGAYQGQLALVVNGRPGNGHSETTQLSCLSASFCCCEDLGWYWHHDMRVWLRLGQMSNRGLIGCEHLECLAECSRCWSMAESRWLVPCTMLFRSFSSPRSMSFDS